MDGNRFDALTKSLATPDSRRGVLKRFGAGIAAGLAGLGLGQAWAAPGGKGKSGGSRCGGPGQPCKWSRQCCGFAGLICLDGACTECPGNYCQETGACLPACTAAQFFDADTCACACLPTTCPPGWTFNQATCSCECPSGNTCAEAGDTCDATVCDPGTEYDTELCACL